MQVIDGVRAMTALEEQVLVLLSEGTAAGVTDPRVEQARAGFEEMVQEHLAALRSRLVGPGGESGQVAWLPALTPPADDGGASPVGVLIAWYAAFHHVALGYAALHTLAHRLYDSEGEGNSADLAERHLRRYTAAAQRIEQLLSDVVVSALDTEGSECRCSCPSCALGLCVCAPHGTLTLVKAWRDTAPGPDTPGVAVRTPRQGSAARDAGLGSGDRVLAADGQALGSDADVPLLQAAVRGHGPGEDVAVTVRGESGESREVRLTRPAA